MQKSNSLIHSVAVKTNTLKQLSPLIPDIVKDFVSKQESRWKAPMKQDLSQVICVFVDVAGFTTLSEKLALKGSIGVEKLVFYLYNHVQSLPQ